MCKYKGVDPTSNRIRHHCDAVPDASSATPPPHHQQEEKRGEGPRFPVGITTCATPTHQRLSELVVPRRVLRVDAPRREVEVVRVEHF